VKVGVSDLARTTVFDDAASTALWIRAVVELGNRGAILTLCWRWVHGGDLMVASTVRATCGVPRANRG
jgi:hypothetical protein